MSKRISRRTFLYRTALGGIGLVILRNSGSAWGTPANDSVGVALIGVAGRGAWFVSLMERENAPMRPVAFCEVDHQRAAEAFGKFPDVPRYDDFRVMLDRQKDIDGVIVSTPEFSRAPILARCLKAGKHVFGEKPLTRLPHESRVIRELALRHKVATQMGNQGTSTPGFRKAVALVQAGLLGEIRDVHVWNGASRPRGDAPPSGGADLKPPSGAEPVPEYLAWDLWLAGSAQRNYTAEWYKGWRKYRDFGTSGLGWWGPHCANLPFMTLKVAQLWDAADLAPKKRRIRITPTVPAVLTSTFPRWEVVRYDIPARGDLPPLTFTWHKGAMHYAEKALGEHPEWRDLDPKPWWVHSGSALVGSKGKLDATEVGARWNVYPAELKDAEQIKNIRGADHEREWLNAGKGQGKTMSNFVHAGAFNEFLMLGNVATLVGQPFTFDPATGKVTDNDAAQAALDQDYRPGWSL